MNRIEFFRLLWSKKDAYLDDVHVLRRRPVIKIHNVKTLETISFKKVDDLLAYKIGEKTILELIEEKEDAYFFPFLDERFILDGDIDWDSIPPHPIDVIGYNFK